MMIFDWHLDLAWNALEWNRDLTLGVEELRRREVAAGYQGPGRGCNTVSLPALAQGQVAVVSATLLARHDKNGVQLSFIPKSGYESAEASYAAAMGQLHYYLALERRGVIRVLRDAPSLQHHVAAWQQYLAHTSAEKVAPPLGFIISMEGADPILTPGDIEAWWKRGLRIVSLSHYGISRYSHGTGSPGPLNPLGPALLQQMEQAGMILDVTHLADEAMDQVFDHFGGTLLASHHNCRSLVDRQRQLRDSDIVKIVERGGVIGASCDNWMLDPGCGQGPGNVRRVATLESVADHIDHVCQLAGTARHAALGTDLDGGFGTEQSPADLDTIADLQRLAPILHQRGYSDHDVEGILWRNWYDLMLRAWLSLAIVMLMAMPTQAGDALKPNIVIILADDMGYSDAGCYGGEIQTPNLDYLASHGLRFTQFYNTSRCWPSRAAILTGYYAQQVRRDTVPGVVSGAQGVRPKWARLLSELLHAYGYRTYHSGKWHVDGQPLQQGFDRSYSLNDHDRHFTPQKHTEDDHALPAVAVGAGYYSSTAIADHAIAHLREHEQKHPQQPFFEFIAFTAPHFPLQAPAADIARYRKTYLAGWDAMRQARWSRLQSMKVMDAPLSTIERTVGPPYAFPAAMKKLGPLEVNRPLHWNDLTAEQREFQANKMAIHAAMVDRMDQEIGRVLNQLRTMRALDKTLFLFLSDNGASAEMMVRGDGHDPHADCGTGATFLSIGPGWSSLANTPFRRHKTWVHEGGISTPFIVHWPERIQHPGEVRHTPGHIVDIVPTLLDVITGSADALTSPSAPKRPGKSLLPVIRQDNTVTVSRDTLWWLHEGNRALRAGPWKIVSAGKDSPWELYYMKEDRTETENLAEKMPARVAELEAKWRREYEAYCADAKRE